ncbi:PilN domain-containing protein [Viridibacterium curvum]|uniref:Fimbrial assembly protein n=1 Tax=Viridibacterium curvum TaxID=1101404 RepID=A0ABP9R3M6_9RHOO
MSQQINLVNPALLPPKPFFQFNSMMLSLVVMAVVLAAFSVLVLSQVATYEREAVMSAQRVTTKQNLLGQLEQGSSKRVASPQMLAEQSAAEGESHRLQQLAGQLALLGTQQPTRSRAALFAALAERPANGVWLTAIDVTGERIALDGMTMSAAHLPVWLEQIKQTTAFAGQRFGGLELGQATVSADGGATAYAFRLSAVRAHDEPRGAP